MKRIQDKFERFEDLKYWGTRVDPTIWEASRAACEGLKITQTDYDVNDPIFARASGGVNVMVSLAIENVSERVIGVAAIRPKMPWPKGVFQCPKKLSAEDLWEWCGYATYGVEPSNVLNHRLNLDFKLYPGDLIEGVLFGTGTASIPNDYAHGALVQMQLVIYTTRTESYGEWFELRVERDGQRETRKPQQSRAARKYRRKSLFHVE